MNKIISLVIIAVAATGGYFWLSQKPEAAAGLEVVMPELTVLAAEGEVVFQGTCAACHGANLTGTEQGPPLLHPYYRPNHHSDYAIVSAVQNGVAPHHWQFGPMPAQTHITDDELVRVIAYIREVQKANGIM